MPTFSYTAETNGQKKSGTIESADESTARTKLTNDGYTSIEFKLPVLKKHFYDRVFNQVSLVQKLFFTQNLEVMVRTGFSLSLALQTLGEQMTNKYFKQVIHQLSADVRSGVSFSNALTKHPSVFSDIFISMISAGELSGKLEEVLKRLTTQLKKDHQLTTKVRNALTYPIIVVGAMIAIGIAMSIFVIPKLLVVFTESKVELPMATKVLIGTSNILLHQGYLIAIGAVGLIMLFARLLKRRAVRHWVDRIMLSAPIMGPIIKKIHLAKFSRTLSSLLETDIHIVESFQIISKILSNSLYRETVIKASEQLKSGVSIAKVLAEQPKLFPPLLIQMITIGEQSGTLDQISSEMALFYEADVDETMGNLSTIIEPVLMLLLGVAVAFLAVAVLLPIYSLTEAV